MNKSDRMAMMAELPVHEVLVKMSLPMIFSFFIQALYNLIDSMFVARLSENALAAVSLAFPMQQIVTAIAVGTATGVSAVWSRCMGIGDREKASRTLRTMTGMSLGFSALFALLGLFAAGPFFRAQTDVAEIAAYGTTYLRICWMCAFGPIFGKYYERLLVSAGRPTLSMAAMTAGAVFNLLFDPLLIFGLGPFPALGIAGAAIATVGGQAFAVAVAIVLNLRHNEAARGDMLRPGFRPESAAAILRIALPSIVTTGLSSVTSFFINRILLLYSTTATAVYGVWMKLQHFCTMPTAGLNNGLVPILSYNYGTGRLDRVKQAMKLAVWSSVGLMCALAVLFELIPGTVLTLFSAGEQMRRIGMACLRVCVVSLPFGAVSTILSTGMQALDHSRYAMAINVLRQCVLLVAGFAFFSAVTHSQTRIWFAVPTTELLGCALSLALNGRMRRDLGF